MLNDRIIVLVGCDLRQVDWWEKKIFSYEEIKRLRLVEVSQCMHLYGYRDGWYILVGEWQKNVHLKEILDMLHCSGFKELDLIFEGDEAAI